MFEYRYYESPRTMVALLRPWFRLDGTMVALDGTMVAAVERNTE